MSQLIFDESKKTVRKPIAKVRITWAGDSIDPTILTTTTNDNRASYPDQISDSIVDIPRKWIQTNTSHPVVNAGYYLMPSTVSEANKYQVGWRGSVASSANGSISGTNGKLTIDFDARPVAGFVVAGDNALNEYPVDYTVTVYNKIGGSFSILETVTITNNSDVVRTILLESAYTDVERMILTITKWSKPNEVPKIAEFNTSFVREYDGDDIVNMSILEETDGSVEGFFVGNISCNELDLSLQNIDDDFFSSNINSDIHNVLKRNRKIEPFIGFNINGVDHYKAKGLYWSGNWESSDQSTTANTTARDRMELLRNITYDGFGALSATKYLLINQSINLFTNIILENLQTSMPDFYYDIDPNFGTQVLPIVFLNRQSWFDCLKKIAQAGSGVVYFDTPTESEVAANPLIRDILRIKTINGFYPNITTTQEAKDLSAFEVITKDDYISKQNPKKNHQIINVVNVKRKLVEINQQTGDAEIYEEEIVSEQNESSIIEYGALKYDYPDNELIQTTQQALDICGSIINEYSEANKDLEIAAFGNPTISIGSVIETPEFQKNNIDIKSKSVVKRITFEYDGSLRANYECRRVGPIYEAN